MDLTGTTLGQRYRLVRTLGAGAVGAVYEGVEASTGRRFAIKLLQSVAPTSSELERFRREAHALAALGNVHIVQLLDFRADPGEPPYLVMELLEGESLGSLLARLGTLRADRVVDYAAQALEALAAAHAAGLVHRDIKVDNLFLATTRSGTHEVLKVVDFGVAKLGRPDLGALTAEGAVVGTLGYLSPEQASGQPVDGRADLYALGVCMYIALSGKMPVTETNYFSTLKRIVHGEITPLARVAPHLDAGLCELVHKALARDRDHRFSSASAMRSALVAYLRGARSEVTVASGAPDPTAPAVASLPPKPALSALQNLPVRTALLVALSGVAFFVWSVIGHRPVRHVAKVVASGSPAPSALVTSPVPLPSAPDAPMPASDAGAARHAAAKSSPTAAASPSASGGGAVSGRGVVITMRCNSSDQCGPSSACFFDGPGEGHCVRGARLGEPCGGRAGCVAPSSACGADAVCACISPLWRCGDECIQRDQCGPSGSRRR